MPETHDVLSWQQLSVLPQESAWLHPASPKSAHVLGLHFEQVPESKSHTSPEGQGLHDFVTPQPSFTGAHPTTPVHVDGVQHAPS